MPRTGAIEYAEPITSTHVLIRTTPCVVCGKQHEFTISRHGYEDWQYGEHIQNALPELSADDREILISGTCGPCFDSLFPKEYPVKMWSIFFRKKDDPLMAFGGYGRTKPTEEDISLMRTVQNAPEDEWDVFIAEVESDEIE